MHQDHQVKEDAHASGCALLDRTDNGCRRFKSTCRGARRELPGLRPLRSSSTARRWLSGRPPPARSNRRLSGDGFVRTFLVNAFEAMDLLGTKYTRDSLPRNAEFRKGRKNFKNLRNWAHEISPRAAASAAHRPNTRRAPAARRPNISHASAAHRPHNVDCRPKDPVWPLKWCLSADNPRVSSNVGICHPQGTARFMQ